jgi:AAA15 family ATPase/GTPase
MYFNKLEINNFRGINSFIAEDLKDINLFVGKNNSSKTTVLEALFLLLGASNPELVIRINNFRDLLLTDQDDLRFIFYNLDYLNPVKIVGETFKKNSFRELKIKPSSIVIDDKKNKKTIESNQSQLSYDTSYSEKTINELILSLSIKEFQKQKKEFSSKILIDRGRYTLTEPKNYIEKRRGVYVTPKIHLSANLEKKLENLIINKKHHEIIEVLNTVDKNITNITFGTNRMIYFDIGISRLVPLNLVGDGIRRILAIILAIYDAQNGIVLIDEIENGLHFSALKPLWSAIFKATQKFKVQLFATTHNIETLKYLKTAIEEETNEKFADNVRSYTLRKIENDIVKSYKYDYEKFEFSIEQGIEIR